MPEQIPKSESSKVRRRVVTAAIAGLALTGAALGVTHNRSGTEAPRATPAATAPAAPQENSAERHITAQQASRQDAKAVMHAIGTMLQQTGGNRAYGTTPTSPDNAAYDNYNQDGMRQPDTPGLSIMRQSNGSDTNMFRLSATTADGQRNVTLTVGVYDGPLAQGEVIPENMIASPSTDSAIDVINLTTAEGGAERDWYGDDGTGHLHIGGDGTKAELTATDVASAGSQELNILQQVADELHTQVPQGDIDILAS